MQGSKVIVISTLRFLNHFLPFSIPHSTFPRFVSACSCFFTVSFPHCLLLELPLNSVKFPRACPHQNYFINPMTLTLTCILLIPIPPSLHLVPCTFHPHSKLSNLKSSLGHPMSISNLPFLTQNSSYPIPTSFFPTNK